jgi:hypothetical protein
MKIFYDFERIEELVSRFGVQKAVPSLLRPLQLAQILMELLVDW